MVEGSRKRSLVLFKNGNLCFCTEPVPRGCHNLRERGQEENLCGSFTSNKREKFFKKFNLLHHTMALIKDVMNDSYSTFDI